MEFSWFTIVVVSLSLCFILKSLLNLISRYSTKSTDKTKLPPGPPNIPILTTFQWVLKSFADFEPFLCKLRNQYGPTFTLQIGHYKSIFISSHDLAHQALITHGSTFSDRPPAPAAARILSANGHQIGSAAYGPLWRLLRRNITSEILHPSRVRSYANARKWVLDILLNKLKQDSGKPVCVSVMEHFQYAMFCLLVLMCFGDKLDDKKIREIEFVQRDLLLSSVTKFNVLNNFPKFGKILFRKRWNLLYKLLGNQEKVLLPLIYARKEKMAHEHANGEEGVTAYVDTLLNLNIPEEGRRKLEDKEIVSLCSEFLNGGSDTTSTALQWIIANIVKHQDIQVRLFEEIKGVVSLESGDEIKEEDLQKMPYLKAVVLEGLRRHPPVHFVLPHAVSEDTRLDEYVVPKGVAVNFMVAELGWDPKVWKDPMEFKPERFCGEEEVFDITGSKEIKMMPFGAGRRICPGLGLALLHLEYFVANLVKEFEWTAETGDEVDLSEKQQEFTTVMKNPLRAQISSRQG